MDFMESEAEESDDEYQGKNSGDEEEEEEDDNMIAEEMKDLINDDEDEEEGAEGSGNESDIGKRKHEDSDLDDQVDEEDLDLIEENLGIKIKRKQKRKRIRMLSDGEESEKEEEEVRDVIANELFDGAEGEEDLQSEMGAPQSERGPGDEFGDIEASEEESDPDDFIVDEEGQSVVKKKKKKTIIHDDKALQEAQDIFGVDFDFEEFEQYDDDYNEEEEEEEEYEDDTGEDGQAAPRKAKKPRGKRAAKSIFEMYEPSDLERAGFTDYDNEIRTADMPERFQVRKTPVQAADEAELDEEAEWVYSKAFVSPTISKQEAALHEGGYTSTDKKGPSAVSKIREALTFMRNQQFEVPFIAFYRKECVEPDLNINDLWRVWHFDEKWTQLRNRKKNLVTLFEKMQLYQCDVNMDPDKPLDSNFRCLTSDDIDRVKGVQSMEELRDVYQHFLLYYGTEIPKMRALEKEKKRKEAAGGGEDGENNDDETHEIIKSATRKSGYNLCERAGLAEMAKRFGLTPEEFAVNLRDNYQKNEVEQYPSEPLELAQEYVSRQFSTVEEVMEGGRHMVAMQIAHDPMVRRCVRETYYERAKISVKPTTKGMKLINEDHPCYQYKYLKSKPVGDLLDDQFLRLTTAEEEGMLTIRIHIDEPEGSGIVPYYEEIKPLYQKDEFSRQVQEWNTQRALVLERALENVLYPHFIKELRSKLLEEAHEGIIKMCCCRLRKWLTVAPYQVDQQMEDDEDYMEGSDGLRVMGVAYSNVRDNKAGDTCSFAVIVDGEGDVQDFLRLPDLMKRKNAYNANEKEQKLDEIEKIREFILNKKPHVIAVTAFDRMGERVLEDLKDIVRELEEDQQIPAIGVEMIDTELATIYQNSKKSESDFREYPGILRNAISIARRIQDPLVEFSQLCGPDEDILCIRYHPLQDQVPKEELLVALNLEFVNRVNEVGVDVNKCIAHSHTAPLVQFVCGLGPRKGNSLLKVLKQNNTRLENRTQLVTLCHMGPKVFINCSGFIKIDTNSLGDSTESYVEVLDGSRVHPETYEWARKMAVDALEYDDTAADANPSSALEEILESPERLKDLDLDAFAEELERQGYGNKRTTLYDIRAELNVRYKDLRQPYRSPSNEEKFNMETKETPQTFYIGKMVTCTVRNIARRRPQGEQLDQANPVRIDATGLWQCPFCQKEDFPELSEVWNHFDAGGCPGQAIGVRTSLDNGVNGFIHTKFLSDKKVTNPEERVQIGMTVHSRIMKIDIDKFTVDLTCKTSDLIDKENTWKLTKDDYYDNDQEEEDTKKEEEKKKQKARQTYVKRVIAHPSFHNIGYNESEKIMKTLEQGDVVIRPSSKGPDHLTATWKVSEGVHAHLDIREEGKENAFSIGSSLWIGNEEFEDLDEIIARHINPMAAFARDLLNYRYYREAEGGKRQVLDKIVMDEKRKAPSKIPYVFSASAQYPGKFLLSYMPRNKVRHEFTTVTPDGVRYRGQVFTSMGSLIRWFKEHFRDPIPGTPQTMRTPMVNPVPATPSINLQSVDAATIQRAAAGLPSNIYNTLAQVAGATPAQQFSNNQQQQGSFNTGYRGGFNFNPPQQHMTTPMMTPMMTPSYQTSQNMTTPRHHTMATPQYQPTPQQQSWNQAISTPRSTPSQRQVSSAQSAAAQAAAAAAVAAAATGRPSTSGFTGVATDWAKAAEMWAKKRQTQVPHKGTPRAGKSPAVRPSPMVESTPAGDGTPLFDER